MTDKTKELNPETIASRAYTKIRRLQAECEAEIKAAPELLRNEYNERIARVEASIESAEAREMLAKLRA